MKETVFYPELRKQIFSVFARVLPMEEFEQWLYKQEYLVNGMDNPFYYDLLEFNYKQNRVYDEFERKFRPLFPDEEADLFAIKEYLEIIVSQKSGWKERYFMLDRMGVDYSYLYQITQYDYLFREENFEEKYQACVRDTIFYANQLLEQIKEFILSKPEKYSDFKVRYVSPKEPIYWMIPKSTKSIVDRKELKHKKPWWQFWK